MQQKKETETVSFERPDIKKIIKDQGSVIEKDLSSTMNEDEPEEDPIIVDLDDEEIPLANLDDDIKDKESTSQFVNRITK